MLTPQIYLLNKGRSHFHKVMHLFSTNCKNCTGVGSQNSSVVQVGKFVLETSGRLSKTPRKSLCDWMCLTLRMTETES